MDEVLLGFSLVVVLSVLARLAASFLRVPAIIPLLVVGVLAGVSFTDIIDPSALLGEALAPIVQIAVGLILFEGALGLKRQELEGGIGSAVVRLLTFGVLVTWLIGSLAVGMLFDVPLEIAVLIGAILIVSGPTVVLPILDFIAPEAKVRSVLKWEGILIDPIGAIIAVVIFGSLTKGGGQPAIDAIEIIFSLGAGLLAGIIGVLLLMPLLASRRLSGRDKVAATLMMVVACFAASDALFADSGLVATIVMGVALANQTRVRIDEIAEFKEALIPLLVGILFVLLASNVEISEAFDLGLPVLGLILVLMFVARPIAVASLAGLGFSRPERTFFSAMAPRGIVAAATASAFGLELTQRGVEGADLIIPITFAVIAVTVFAYGLGTPPLARYLGLVGRRSPALLLIGAPRWGLALGSALATDGVTVKVWTEDKDEEGLVEEAGLANFEGALDPGNASTDSDFEDLTAIALVSKDETLNQTLSRELTKVREPDQIYRLRPLSGKAPIVTSEATPLFREPDDAAALERRLDAGQKMVLLATGEAPPGGTVAVASIKQSGRNGSSTIRLASDGGGRLHHPDSRVVALGPAEAFPGARTQFSDPVSV
ncbi:MAG: sodium:proton antiporter [Solirubrobacterales bacterium]